MVAVFKMFGRQGLAIVIVCGLCAGGRGQDRELEFNRDIRPILSQNCLACHGIDAKKRQAELRLDDAESALAEKDGTAAIKPGRPDESELWKRINSDDPDAVMPPPSTKRTLTAEQKETLRRWIAEGSKFQKHWAFEKPVLGRVPEVKQRDWVKNDIDAHILHRLERDGLRPQEEADRETLIRRVSFAVTGLPPTIAEVDQFLNDTSANAYEQMVDRYLQSPRFGEEMAREWLDVARYADTHGLHLDNERLMWAYRDWVISAFNENLPFDQFTIWQIAGDQLPNPTREQLIATGFNRCNVTTSEGGALDVEFRYRYAVDRTSTAVQAWMGLTAGCAVCHDHKYDPLSTKEFYSLYAFFNSAADPAMDGNIYDTKPVQPLPSSELDQLVIVRRDAEKSALAKLEEVAKGAEYNEPAERTLENRPVTQVIFDDYFPPGSITRNTSRNPSVWEADTPFGAPSGRRVLKQSNSYFTEETVENKLAPVVVPNNGQMDVWVRFAENDRPAAVAVAVNNGAGMRRVVWGVLEAFDGEGKGFGNYGKQVHKGPLPDGSGWHRLSFAFSELEITGGQRLSTVVLQETGGNVWWDAPTVVGELAAASDPGVSFTAWWKSQAGSSPAEVPNDLLSTLKGGPDGKPEAEKAEALKRYYLAHFCRAAPTEVLHARRAYMESKALRMAAEDAVPKTMIYGELPSPRDSFVMMRGQYDKPGDKVEPGVPAVFPPLMKEKSDGPATRLDLAKWLVSAEHPLTARVFVNRLWQQMFGTGLVKTSYDFGTQGETPTHPELLDALSVKFQESGWNVKGLVREMLTSATFRQSSSGPTEGWQRDPENRLYGRGPRFRLVAEQIRDNVLATSGLLSLKMGGPGVKIYQPPNIWEPVGYGDSNTRYYLQDHGEALYRRSVYCFLKRTAPPPFMSNFDGPNREQFCSRRERSNTPLQALQLMNDTQHFEAARALAERTIGQGGTSPESRIEFLYRTVLSRKPRAEELTILKDALAEQQGIYASNEESAKATIQIGESKPRGVANNVETAAWTMIANLVLNLDETVTRN